MPDRLILSAKRRPTVLAALAVVYAFCFAVYSLLRSSFEDIRIQAVSAYSTRVEREDVNLQEGRRTADQQAEGFKPRSDIEPWPLKLPIAWDADPFEDQNWLFHLHSWRMMDPHLADYFETGDVARLGEALAYALDWHRFHEDLGRSADMSWYDMAAGIRAMKIALLIDRYRTGELTLSEEQAKRLFHLADQHAERLQREAYISLGNHGFFQVFGLDLLCAVISERPVCEDARPFAVRMFNTIMVNQFTDQGVHREHSPAYHGFTRRIIERQGGERFDNHTSGDNWRRVAAVEPWLAFPNGEYAQIGDSDGRTEPLHLAPGETAVGDFSRSGYAVVRDRDSMLFVSGMANNHVHKHADDLAFELFEFGRFIFVDTGKYGYNRDRMRAYVESAAAHNTVSVAEFEIGPTDVVMEGSHLRRIEQDEAAFLVTGELNRPGLFRQFRQFRYEPGRSIEIHDQLSSEQHLTYRSSLNLAPDLVPVVIPGGFRVAAPEFSMSASVEERDCEIAVARGETDPYRGWTTVSYLRMEPTSTVQAICSGADRTITWRIEFEPTGANADPDQD